MYSFANVTVIVDGKIITGHAEDSVVKAVRNEDAVTSKVGVDGGVAHAQNPNKSGLLTFSLFQSSASLPQLRRIAKDAKEVPVTVRDATAGSGFLLQQDNCVVQKVPEYARGKDTEKVEISIFVPNLDIIE